MYVVSGGSECGCDCVVVEVVCMCVCMSVCVCVYIDHAGGRNEVGKTFRRRGVGRKKMGGVHVYGEVCVCVCVRALSSVMVGLREGRSTGKCTRGGGGGPSRQRSCASKATEMGQLWGARAGGGWVVGTTLGGRV